MPIFGHIFNTIPTTLIGNQEVHYLNFHTILIGDNEPNHPSTSGYQILGTQDENKELKDPLTSTREQSHMVLLKL